MSHAGRSNARCPSCLSLERHRLLWLFLSETGILSSTPSILHFGPEVALQQNLRALGLIDYVSADLSAASTVDLRADITDIPFDEHRFDPVLCNHVLEHLPDHRLAMRELRRALKPTGTAIMRHPVDSSRPRDVRGPEHRLAAGGSSRLRSARPRTHLRLRLRRSA